MSTNTRSLPKLVLAVATLIWLFWPAPASARTILVQTVGEISTGPPAPGCGPSSYIIEIDVVVTDPVDGSPVITLGPASAASLPTGWKFYPLYRNGYGPGTPCSVSQFANNGNGRYHIQLGAGDCFPIFSQSSLGGLQNLHYVVEISGTFNGVPYTGSGLGVI